MSRKVKSEEVVGCKSKLHGAPKNDPGYHKYEGTLVTIIDSSNTLLRVGLMAEWDAEIFFLLQTFSAFV